MAHWRSTIARLLFHGGRMADRISRVTTYLAAATRRLEEMQADHKRSWDRFYQSHPSQETRLLPWEEACLGRFMISGAKVLLIGCGSGRDLLALVERGCEVTGLDASGEGVRIAERLLSARGLSAKLICGFFESTPLPHRFDVVIFSYYCYAAIPMTSRRVAALEKAAAQLNAAGHVVVSHAAGVQRPRSVLVHAGRIAGALTRSDWRVESGDLLSADSRDRPPSLSFTHAFEHGELEREAAAANLRVVFRHVADDGTVVAVFAHP